MKSAPCKACDAPVIAAHTMAGVPVTLDAAPVDEFRTARKSVLFLLELGDGGEPCAYVKDGKSATGYRVHVCPSTAGPRTPVPE